MHKEESKFFGIEINPRFGGGFPLSYLSGANYPEWIIKEFLKDEKIGPQFDSWERNLLMIRYDDEIMVHGYRD
jgi:carbamoyl-phosphate synthase large subunit